MEKLMLGLIQLSPLWVLSLTSFAPLILKVLNNNQEIKPFLLFGFHAFGIFISFLLFFFVGFQEGQVLTLNFDAYGSLACILIALAGFQSLFLFEFNRWIDKDQLTEILFLFSHGLLALYIVCLSQDLMTAFVGLELASLIVYINLAMSKKDPLCLESSMKYFVLSALAGACFLYGLSFLFGSLGSLEFQYFFSNQITYYNRFFFLGFALVFVGLFFKLAVFPFQFWLADVYQGTSTPMTSFMATVFKSAVVLFVGRLFLLPFFDKGEHGFALISALGVASVFTVLFGNIMALKQIKIKRLIAFSSIAHSGYMMMILVGILNLDESAKNLTPLVYYVLSYIFMTGGLLTCVQCLESDKTSQVEIKDFKALFYKNPWVAFCASLFLVGLAGLPPTFGFFAKLAFLQPLVLASKWWILLWAFVGSAIGLYYYMKPITWMLEPVKPSEILEASEASKNISSNFGFSAKLLLSITSFGTLLGAFVFGFFF